MSLAAIVLIVLILMLLWAIWTWPHSRRRGYAPSGVLGLMVIIIVVLLLMGRLWAWVCWCAAKYCAVLPLDHARHIAEALAQLRDTVGGKAPPLHVLPDRFTLTALQRAVEVILGAPIEKSAFRKPGQH